MFPELQNASSETSKEPEMSNQLSVMTGNLQNPTWCLEVCTSECFCLCREEDMVFANAVDLKVCSKIPSGPGVMADL